MKSIELTEVPVDQRGHRHVSSRFQADSDRPVLDAFVTTVNDTDAWADGFAMVHNASSCSTCDMHAMFDVVADPDGPEGIGLRAKTECLLPDGVENVFYLSVRSGKIVVADDLRPVFPSKTPLTPGYCSAAGQTLFSAQQASAGVATGATTSGSGHLVRLGPPAFGVTDGGRYAIVSFDDEAEPGDDDYFDLGSHGEVLADIDLSVWSYAIADYGDWKCRLDALNIDPDDLRDHTVIDFPNGTYQFVHHTTRADVDAHDDPWPKTYADIVMIHPRPTSIGSGTALPLSDTLAVADFMRAFDQPVRTTPTQGLPDEERLLRARLVLEEALEFVEAMGCVATTSGHELVTKSDAEVHLDLNGSLDLVEATDALADLIVVVKGSAWTLGVPVDEAFQIVHATNMAKLDPTTGKPLKRADGKVVKPEGWRPPTEALRVLLGSEGRSSNAPLRDGQRHG